METVIIYVALVLFGATFGSYGAALVWRLRARQLQADKDSKETYDKKEYNRLKKLFSGSRLTSDRSQCLSCSSKLRWYDLIPVFSWLALRGKCRACHKPIGRFELLMELGVAAFFVGSYLFWPGGINDGLQAAHFILWLAAGVVMAVLFAYDFKWFILPDRLVILLAIVGLAIVGVSAAETQDVGGTLLTAVGAVAALSGLYGAIFVLSKGKWVGFGDVKLGIGLGLILVDWQLALIALFLANLVGTLIVIPLLATKKLKRNAHVPFGPLLIIGTASAWFIGWPILDWYLVALGI